MKTAKIIAGVTLSLAGIAAIVLGQVSLIANFALLASISYIHYRLGLWDTAK